MVNVPAVKKSDNTSILPTLFFPVSSRHHSFYPPHNFARTIAKGNKLQFGIQISIYDVPIVSQSKKYNFNTAKKLRCISTLSNWNFGIYFIHESTTTPSPTRFVKLRYIQTVRNYVLKKDDWDMTHPVSESVSQYGVNLV